MLTAVRELVSAREVLWELARRDLRIRYKQTLLGMAWAVFTPLAMMVIFSYVFTRVAKVDTGEVPYCIFVYCGLLPWQFFASCLKGSVESLTRNSRLVTKLYFPRGVFPLAQIVSSGVDFLVAASVLVLLMAWFGFVPRATVLFLPIVLLVQLLWTAGLGFLLSMGNLFYRDVKYVFEVILLLWMFVTSVVYPIRLEGNWSWVLAANPMTPLIDAYRSVLLAGELPDPIGFGYVSVLAIAAAAGGLIWFHRTEHLFAEHI